MPVNVVTVPNLGNSFDLGSIQANKIHVNVDGATLVRNPTSGLISAAADFWRTLAGATPVGSAADTTVSIRRIGHVGVGGAAVTDAMPTVTAPSATNRFLHLSSNASGRGQLMFGGSPLSYYLTRSLPGATVGDYVDIGTLSPGFTSPFSWRLTITINSSGFNVARMYACSSTWNATSGAWRVLRPLSDGGLGQAPNSFELLVNIGGSSTSWRIRRTGGATVSGTIHVRIEALDGPTNALTESSATGNDATAYTTFDPFSTWSTLGNAGTSASAYTSAGVQGGNYLGTTDKQPVVIYTNANDLSSKTDLALLTATPVAAAVAAPVDILRLRRGGSATSAQSVALALGHWFADTNARTRLDIRLGNGGLNTPDLSIMSMFSHGPVGISSSNPSPSWGAVGANTGIGKSGVGSALLALDGADGQLLGPHVQFTTSADNFPVRQDRNWAHNDSALSFDGYYDGSWKFSHTTRAYSIYKVADQLRFYGASAAGVAGGAWSPDLMALFQYAGATAAGGELSFNNVVKNRRIVLFDTTSTSDHQYVGFGYNTNQLRYQVSNPAHSHVFYHGSSANSSQEIARLNSGGLTLQIGNGFKPGGGAWATTSDIRVKTDVSAFTPGLSAVLALNPVSFRYNGKAGAKADGRTHYGLIAQEVQTVLPEFVEEIPISDDVYDAMSKGDRRLFPSKSILALSEGLTNFEAVLIRAVQELSAQNVALSERIAKLEAMQVS